MKEYFKYQCGYVNIDDENLFITNTGNWSETRTMNEKSSDEIKVNKRRKAKTEIIVYLLFIAGIIFIIEAFSDWDTSSFTIFGSLFFLRKVYDYFKDDLGNKYKVPRSKITSIHINKNELMIEFLNLDGELDTETLKKVEEKGIKIMKRLNITLPYQ